MKWNAETYAKNCLFVSFHGEELIGYFGDINNKKVLDLGCGTGVLTKKLAETGAIVTGIDSSIEMLEFAKAKCPNAIFRNLDILDMDYKENFDCIFSSAVLHWIEKKNQAKALKNIYNALDTDGIFVAEMGGFGNAEIILSNLEKVCKSKGLKYQENRYFPTSDEYMKLLSDAGFEVDFISLFNRPTVLSDSTEGLKNWITQFCGATLDNLDQETQNAVINETNKLCKHKLWKTDHFEADYVRLRIVAYK